MLPQIFANNGEVIMSIDKGISSYQKDRSNFLLFGRKGGSVSSKNIGADSVRPVYY
jgi:hypothetical protein